MSNFDENRSTISRRHSRAFGWLTAGAILILLAVGAAYTTGRWGEDATRTGGSAPAAQVPTGAGPNAPSVPNTR